MCFTDNKKGEMKSNLTDCFQFDGEIFPNHGKDILMQFTGLKDKNGKEIYEGDLVKVGKEVMSVFWYKQSSEFWLLHLNLQDNSNYCASSGVPARDWNWLDDGKAVNWHKNTKIAEVEIIGNIYENQELIK